MTVVVFLRGMNLGKRRLTNEQLIAVFERSGFADASAYQASGNIMLPRVDEIDPAHLRTNPPRRARLRSGRIHQNRRGSRRPRGGRALRWHECGKGAANPR